MPGSCSTSAALVLRAGSLPICTLCFQVPWPAVPLSRHSVGPLSPARCRPPRHLWGPAWHLRSLAPGLHVAGAFQDFSLRGMSTHGPPEEPTLSLQCSHTHGQATSAYSSQTAAQKLLGHIFRQKLAITISKELYLGSFLPLTVAQVSHHFQAAPTWTPPRTQRPRCGCPFTHTAEGLRRGSATSWW